MYALFPIRSTCYVLCRVCINANSRMYFALKLHEVSPCPCPYPCLEGMVLVLEGQVLVLVLGGSVLVNITVVWLAKFEDNVIGLDQVLEIHNKVH